MERCVVRVDRRRLIDNVQNKSITLKRKGISIVCGLEI